MDPKHIEVISPTDLNETLIKCSTMQLALDTEISASTSVFVKKIWRAKITKLEELHEFVDEVQCDRLLKWSHAHRFIKVDDKQTRIIDEVNFEFGYGIIGRIIERIVFPRIERLFSYRERKIKEVLEH